MSDIGLPDMGLFLVLLGIAAITMITALILLTTGYMRHKIKMKRAGWLSLLVSAGIVAFLYITN